MSSTISMELFRNEIVDILNETFEQVSGIYLDRGTSLFETLDTISAQAASQPVSKTCATIAAQVAHLCFYIDVLAGHMTANPPQNVDWKHIWLTVSAVSSDEWEASKARLKVSYANVMTQIKTFDQWDSERMAGALAIAVHTAYHLGEIRQALCTVQNDF